MIFQLEFGCLMITPLLLKEVYVIKKQTPMIISDSDQ